MRDFQFILHLATDEVWPAIDVSLMDHATSCTVAVLSEYSRCNLDYKMIEGPSMEEVMQMNQGSYKPFKTEDGCFDIVRKYHKLRLATIEFPIWCFFETKKGRVSKRAFSKG